MTVRPWSKPSTVDTLKDAALSSPQPAADAKPAKPARPTVKYKGDYTPPPSPMTRHRRAKAGLDPDKPVEKPKAEKPRKPRKTGLYPVAQDDTVGPGVNATASKLVELMVWEAMRRDEAIEKLGISKSYAYRLLRSPDVMAHYRAECVVLRSSDHSRMLHRLSAIAEQDDNKNAAVAAIKIHLGEHNGEPAGGNTVNVNVTLQPGYVIDVSAARNRGQLGRLSTQTIEHEPEQGDSGERGKIGPAMAAEIALLPDPAPLAAGGHRPSPEPPGAAPSTGGRGRILRGGASEGVGGKMGRQSSIS